jgi:hypothetical protein
VAPAGDDHSGGLGPRPEEIWRAIHLFKLMQHLVGV